MNHVTYSAFIGTIDAAIRVSLMAPPFVLPMILGCR